MPLSISFRIYNMSYIKYLINMIKHEKNTQNIKINILFLNYFNNLFLI